MKSNVLYWFTNDLRVEDNLALNGLTDNQSLLCVYIVDPDWFKQELWQGAAIGRHRWNFLLESLSELNQILRSYGQQLHVIYGRTQDELAKLIEEYNIDILVCSKSYGIDEQGSLNKLQRAHSHLKCMAVEQYTLFMESQWPSTQDGKVFSYSKFRRKVERADIPEPLGKPSTLPPPPTISPAPSISQPSWIPSPSGPSNPFRGGALSAKQHISIYFTSALASTYKETRNSLAGWENSCKFSPWLNHGCVSARQILARLRDYESAHGANESTQWIFVELLWREYFQWLSQHIGKQLFDIQGLRKSPPLTSFYPERFKKWCEGQTPYRLVNACMKELKQTGYLSNRGRQIVASCLVNELNVDWRYGAAWFEHQLIDYDVAVNWGNWQYIAGVGVDPRGGRHFNIEKQSKLYDPEGKYQTHWGATETHNLDSVDAADWPITL